MLLTAKPINSDGTTNIFEYIGVWEVIRGEKATFKCQLFQTERDLRYVPASTATVDFIFMQADGSTTTTKSATIDANDRSIVSVDLTAAETTDLRGGNVKFQVDVADDDSDLITGILDNVLKIKETGF